MSNDKFVLNTGSEIPVLGLDTAHCRLEHLDTSIFSRFRHFHILAGETNENVLGKSIEHLITIGKLRRSNIFITVTIACSPQTNVEKALDRSLVSLGVEYADLCLMKWDHTAPSNVKSHIDIYKDLENLKRRWKTRAVGLSGYSVESLQDLVRQVSIKPAVVHFYATLSQNQATLVDYCNWNGILSLTAPSVDMGADRGGVAPLVQELARKYQTTSENIIFNWHMSSRKGVLVDSPSAGQLSRVDLARHDVHQLDELSQDNAESGSYHQISSPFVEPRCNGRTGGTLGGLDANPRQVLPVL